MSRPVLALAAWLLIASPAFAQYFGQNKIRYHDFDFAVLATEHFDVYYYPAEKVAARRAAVLAERWYDVLSRSLHRRLERRQPLVLYASHPDFAQTNVVDGWLGEATGGVTEGQRQRIVIPIGPGLAETDHVIGHELVHAFQYDIARHGHPGLLAMPLWFIEGMAEFLSRGPDDPQTAMWIRDAVRTDTLPSVPELQDPRFFPYRYGHAFWTFLTRRFGDGVLLRLLMAKAESVKARLTIATGMPIDELTKAWRAWAASAYPPAIAGETTGPRTAAQTPTPVITREKAGRINVGPSLSPDGRQMAFVSEKDLFSIEVFLADAATGRVVRKLIDRATNPHFDSLEFVESAGTWAPDGKRLAFAAVRGGEPVLVVLDTAAGRTVREIPFPQFGQVWTPAWSPDGRSLAFTASHGGDCDLYIVELAGGRVRQLTDDAYADLQPSWSPDGRRIAFVTDRFTTDLGGLRAGAYQLAVLDLDTRRTERVTGAGEAQCVTPIFSSDGGSLYFVGRGGGATNVYRVELQHGTVTRVTGFAGGVAGITPTSPAISIAAHKLAYSVYSRGGYDIGVLDLPPVLDVAPVVTLGASPAPPAAAASESMSPTAPSSAVESPSLFRERPYRRTLTLDGIGQPYLSAGGGTLGAFFRAGVVMSFADMLGDQSLFLALQGGRHADDFAGRAVYLNRRSRWNWGVSLDYLPAVFTRTESEYVPDTNSIRHVTEYMRQTYTGVSGLALYPFNRASRLEFSAGLRRIAFANELESRTISASSGRTTGDTTDPLASPRALHIAETSAALVFDSAIQGPTSPLVGRRYRFEVAPSFGSLAFATLLADFRQYVMPVKPFTLAFRARYIARVGRDAADPRLLPLVLNLRDQVRGYDLQNIATGACAASASVECSALDVMTGSRLFTANAEVRFPLWGVWSRSIRYGPLPVEGFAFADLGALRTKVAGASDAWKHSVLRSVGAGVRLNAAGVVFEFAAARPLDGTAFASPGWRFTFNLLPGF